MLTYGQAILLGLLQGVTELFPISSLGHSVLLPALLGWHLNEGSQYFLLLLVATHFATALVLFGFFFNDWMRIIAGFFRSLLRGRIERDDVYARLAWVIIVATIPAGLIGLLFQTKLQELFATPTVVAVFLMLNGGMLYLTELLRIQRMRLLASHASVDLAISRLPWISAIGTGFAQSLALLPGFSRTGSSLSGGLLSGLDHESAARFAFLLATPIILAASVLKLPELIHVHQYPVYQIGAGAIAAAVGALVSVAFLTRYFKSNTLRPFAIYCIAAGFISLILLTRAGL
ncbi:MAG: undecaprenyl-diphosphate phosphatase [Candidatus Pacebacteria bacterium]|nr:undecaprenyl-diphosphate phosphatase [Candidatus Paceibacterota bacterium]